MFQVEILCFVIVTGDTHKILEEDSWYVVSLAAVFSIVMGRSVATRLRSSDALSKHFNIEPLEVIFGCRVTNTYDDDTMSPDVGI